MSRAVARNPSGKDLAALGDEEPERFYVLIVDKRRFVDAETAHLFSDLETSFSVTRTLAVLAARIT